jgi:hypothetical protein
MCLLSGRHGSTSEARAEDARFPARDRAANTATEGADKQSQTLFIDLCPVCIASHRSSLQKNPCPICLGLRTTRSSWCLAANGAGAKQHHLYPLERTPRVALSDKLSRLSKQPMSLQQSLQKRRPHHSPLQNPRTSSAGRHSQQGADQPLRQDGPAGLRGHLAL